MRQHLTMRLWSRLFRLLINNETVTDIATALKNETVVKTLTAINHNETSLNNENVVTTHTALNQQ